MEMKFENEKFVIECTYQEFINGMREIIKDAKFRWNPDQKVWWTDDISKAIKLSEYAVGNASIQIKKYIEAINGSRAASADIDIPCPAGLSYRDYQKAGIAYGMDRDGLIIADEMGLGKTIQVLGILNTMAETKNILVICPASVKSNWKNESLKWLVYEPFLTILSGSKKPKHFGNPESKTKIYVTNYDNVYKEIDGILSNIVWDVLVCDECHKLKNYKAIRTCVIIGGTCQITENKQKVTKQFAGIQAKKRLFLTGTPIVNRPSEFIGMLHSVAPRTFPKIGSYLYRYCEPKEVHIGKGNYRTTFQGASNTEELNEKLRGSCMIRRMKNQVLTELPDKIHTFNNLDIAGMKTYYKEMADVLGVDPKDFDAMANAMLGSLDPQQFSEISKIRHKIGVAKIIPAIKYIQDIIDAGEKVLVFAHHTDVLNGIQKAFENTVRIDGSVDSSKRQHIVDQFQNDDSIRIFLGSIRACGEGLTLTKASQVIFVEEDWTPGAMKQAEDRAHRIGQTDTVCVHHLLANESIDELIHSKLIEKSSHIHKVLDAKTEIEKQEIPIGTKAKKSEKPTQTPRTQTKQEEQSELKQLIHDGLKILASVCDGAFAEDGSGFNKIDTDFGCSLAHAPRLSDKQFIHGLRLVRKYKRQIPEIIKKVEQIISEQE